MQVCGDVHAVVYLEVRDGVRVVIALVTTDAHFEGDDVLNVIHVADPADGAIVLVRGCIFVEGVARGGGSTGRL